jgi:hypothetical protein
VQLALRQGEPPASDAVGAAFATAVAAIGALHALTLRAAGRAEHVLEAVAFGAPALASICVHRFVGKSADGKPIPAFDDLLAAHFHLATAVACAYLVAFDARRAPTARDAPPCVAFALSTPLLLVAACAPRAASPLPYHSVVGTLFAATGAVVASVTLRSALAPEARPS